MVRGATGVAVLSLASVALSGGCALLGPGRPVPTACAVTGPGISASVSPENILAVTLAVPSVDADSARALYRVDNGPEQTTPWVAVVGPTARMPILGLHERARLSALVQLSRAGATALSPGVTCVAGSLPGALRGMRLETRYGQRSGGYILTEVLRDHRAYAVAFDSLGRIAWYRSLGPGRSVGDVKQQHNGHITAWVGNSRGYEPDARGRFLELLPTGELVREYRAPAGYYTDPHELQLVFRGGSLRAAYLFGYDLRHVRVVRKGKLKPLAAHTVFRLEPSGAATPIVSGWQLFTLADTVAAPHPDAPDFDHPNSIDFDRDGNLIISFRNFDQVTKVDARTGAVIWRLGGPGSTFRFVGDPDDGFAGQHDARILPGDNLLLYDDRWNRPPLASRGVEYHLDLASRTATMVAAFQRHPRLYTPATGSAQRLASGYTLVGYAYDYLLDEFNPATEEIAESVITGVKKLGIGYRMIMVRSLYRYEEP